MTLPDPAFWRGRRVLVTGATGFKGGWLALWLARMGATVTGYALAPEHDHGICVASGVAHLTTPVTVNSLPTVTPLSRPIVTPSGVPDWAYPRSA